MDKIQHKKRFKEFKEGYLLSIYSVYGTLPSKLYLSFHKAQRFLGDIPILQTKLLKIM